MEKYHTIYLTGAQATGKSTVASFLKTHVDPIQVYSYSQMLSERLNRDSASAAITHEDMRQQSSQIITPEDINAVDELLLKTIEENREKAHLIIDSHPVTKENYGFRVTSFSLEQLKILAPTLICVLYAKPKTILNRMKANAEGRQSLTKSEVRLFAELQANVAINYGVLIHAPVYFLDTTDSTAETIAGQIITRLKKKNSNTIVRKS